MNDVAFVASTLVSALVSLGVEAELIQPGQPGASWRYPWKLATFPFRLGALARVVFDIRRGRHDLVHIHYARLGIIGPFLGRPYVIHCHGTDIRGVTPSSAWGRVMQLSLARAARVFFATPDLAPWVSAFRPDAEFLPNPIVDSVRPRRRVAETRDVLIGVRLDPGKGSERIEALLRALIRRRPAIGLTIISHGRDAARIVAAVRGRAQVIDPVPHAAMSSVFAAHRIAIGQLLIGAIGNYELEALAAGLPVVSTFRFPEAYPEPPPLIEFRGEEATAATIADLLDDDHSRDALSEIGRAWVLEYHGQATIGRRVAESYRSILERR